ncbi:MAG: hypothetical protein KA801_05245 [Syntrophorhabdaceae bacterium]|nr:hypothetical protein [Syntrophorhabdaceae bacterium]
MKGDRPGVGYLPGYEDRQEDQRARVEPASCRAVSGKGRCRPGQRADRYGVDGIAFQVQAVDENINGKSGQHDGQAAFSRRRQKKRAARNAHEGRTDNNDRRGNEPPRKGTVSGPEHPAVDVPVDAVVEGTGRGDDKGYADDGRYQKRHIDASPGSKKETSRRGDKVRRHHPRLCDEHVVLYPCFHGHIIR